MAESWFLKIDGIQGESADVSHKDEIDVLSWSWGVANSGTLAPGGGGGAGKAQFQAFHFVAKIGRASPALFLACATGQHHKDASLSGVRGAGKSKSAEFLRYKLSDVIVSTVQHSDTHDSAPMEQFSLNYSKIEVSYTPQLASGKVGAPIRAGFDLKANKKI